MSGTQQSKGTVQVPNANGSACCECGAQGSGCSCNPLGSILCHSRGGFACFCGFAEYTNPSNPPLYYLKKTLSGSMSFQNGPPGCVSFTCSQSWTYSGSTTYDPNTCGITQTGQLTTSNGCGAGGVVATGEVHSGDINSFGGATWPINDVYDQVSHSLINPNVGNCVYNSTGTGDNLLGTSSCAAILSQLDTTTNAINRYIATNHPAWGGTTDCNGACSFILSWGPGQTCFAFSQAQVMASVTNPVPGHSYKMTIQLVRKPAAGGVAANFAQLVQTVICPPTGPCQTGWLDIPATDLDYAVCASSVTVQDVTGG